MRDMSASGDALGPARVMLQVGGKEFQPVVVDAQPAAHLGFMAAQRVFVAGLGFIDFGRRQVMCRKAGPEAFRAIQPRAGEREELAEPLAEFGGLYATHLRSEFADILNAMDEAFRIGNLAAVAMHVPGHTPADIAYRDGAFEVVGTDRRVGLFELAAWKPFDGDAVFADKIESFPTGVMVCEVEVDPDTGDPAEGTIPHLSEE